jgi:nucleoside-diphosphate-sugar epimerase
MKALITGATGYIGGCLVKHLNDQGWGVHCLVRPSSDIKTLVSMFGENYIHTYDGSFDSMIDVLESSRPDVVFHLASLFVVEHKPDQVDDLLYSNIIMGSHLLEAMTHTRCESLVNVGTYWQFFHSSKYRPVNLYAATKQCFEDILFFYTDAKGLKSVTVYLFDTYGPEDDRGKVFNLLINAAKNNKSLGVSPGEQVLKFTHVADVVETLEDVAGRVKNAASGSQEFYLIGGDEVTLKELVNIIREQNGPLNVSFGEREYRHREVMEVSSIQNSIPVWEKKSYRDLAVEIKRILN